MVQGAYLVFGRGPSLAVARRVAAAARKIEAAPPPWLLDWIPAYDSIFLELDATAVSCPRLEAWAKKLVLEEGGEGEAERLVELPVRYDGPDLADVAERAGIEPEEVVRLHAGTEYRVYAVGFTPGFPFMAELPPPLRMPRRPTPRARVPAHSVGLAGAQTGVYPQESPGGWNLIGRTLVRVYDPHRDPIFLLQPGDRVRFLPAEGEVPPPPELVEVLGREGRPLLRVLEPGLLTLPLDRGRFRAGRYGLARSGPMDARSFEAATRMVGGAATALELNLVGPLLEALEEVTVALAGIGPGYDGNWGRTVTLRKGETLDLRRPGPGARSYLALPGGFALERFMGSASPDLKGRIGRPLAAGDVLRQEASTQPRRLARTWSPTPLEPREGPVRLRILPGPQADAEALASLTTATFRVGHADRMGLRLEGASVPGGEVTSEGVPLGAVQVPPGGAPMLLLADRGTIGGYAKPAVLHPADLSRAGQLKEGDRVRFVLAKNAPAYCTVAL